MHSDYALSVAAEVRAHMGRQRMTQTALATHMGVSQGYISRRLTGEVPFTVTELDEIARILTVPISDLLPEQQTTTSASMRKAG